MQHSTVPEQKLEIDLSLPETAVVLQKLFKDRAILTISSRYAATPKNFDTNST
jgi:hypothetical protein